MISISFINFTSPINPNIIMRVSHLLKRSGILLLCFVSCILAAQSPDWVHMTKSSLTTCFAEEGDYIWIGDLSGVVKMHKKSGEISYFNKATSGLPDNDIRCMAIGNDGVKWFGTYNHGLVKFDDLNWSVYDTANSSIPVQIVTEIAIDSSNNVWIGGDYIYGGLYRFDGINWTHYNKSNSGLPSDQVYSILADGIMIWVSTKGGISRFDGTEWTTFTTQNSTLSDHTALEMCMDREGNLWIARYSSIEKFDGSSFTLYNNGNSGMPNTNQTSMAVDHNNMIWTGCLAYLGPSGSVLGGIMSFNGSTWSKYDKTNSIVVEEAVLSIFADKTGNIWAGGYDGNVYRKKEDTWLIYNTSETILDGYAQIKSIDIDRNNLAYITNGTELVKFDGQEWESVYKDEVPFSIDLEADGVIYVRSWKELKRYNGKEWEIIPVAPGPFLRKNEENHIAIGKDNGIWIDNYVYTLDENQNVTIHFGVAHFNGESWTEYSFLNSNLPDSRRGIIEADRNKDIWVASGNELAKFVGTQWITYQVPDSLLFQDNIQGIVFDENNNLWIPNGSFGVVKFDGIQFTEFKHPSMEGYVANFHGGEQDNDGKIWQLNSQAHLSSFDGEEWTSFTPENSPLPEGINCTALGLDIFGNIWIGTSVGILKYKHGGVITDLQVTPVTSTWNSIPFPNPFKGSFRINLDQPCEKAEISLFSVLGSKISTKRYENEESIVVERNKIPPGIYFYHLIIDNKDSRTGTIIAQ